MFCIYSLYVNIPYKIYRLFFWFLCTILNNSEHSSHLNFLQKMSDHLEFMVHDMLTLMQVRPSSQSIIIFFASLLSVFCVACLFSSYVLQTIKNDYTPCQLWHDKQFLHVHKYFLRFFHHRRKLSSFNVSLRMTHYVERKIDVIC